jgi:hypothetical protein
VTLWESAAIRPPDLDWLDVAFLAALPAPPFARPLDCAFVRCLAQGWTRADDEYIVHVAQRPDGTIVLVDGRHHVAAAVLAERIRLPVAVYEGLTPDEEAALFTALNMPGAST